MRIESEIEEGKPSSRNPTVGIFFVCCASTEPQSAKRIAQRVRTVIFLYMSLALSLHTPHSPFFSLDHLIRPCQHIGRDRQADLPGCFKIDDQVELFGCSTGRSEGFAPFRILST